MLQNCEPNKTQDAAIAPRSESDWSRVLRQAPLEERIRRGNDDGQLLGGQSFDGSRHGGGDGCFRRRRSGSGAGHVQGKSPTLSHQHRGARVLVSRLSAALDLLQGGRMAYLPPLEVEEQGRLYYYESIDQRLYKQLVRESEPKYLEIQGQQMRAAIQCLKYYNDRHPGSEYVLASEKVMENSGTNMAGVVWTHGNFVARQRKAWCFSFLYGPPTLFFFEMNGSPYHGGIVTCAPLDEPVNEAYRFLGFPLWWAKRRSGKYDCVCLICGWRHTVQGPCPEKFSCGHRRINRLCRMCYRRSEVLHPSPAEFEHGHQIDAKFTYFCVMA